MAAGISAFSQQNRTRFSTKSALYKIDRQANYAVAAFLMPRQAVINGAREYFEMSSKTDMIYFEYAPKDKIKRFGRPFGVNYSPMVYRMKEIGLLDKDFESSYM